MKVTTLAEVFKGRRGGNAAARPDRTIARVRLGVAAPAGAPQPDISS